MDRAVHRRPTLSSVIATVAIATLFGSGSAVATHLVVRSSDIVDGEVRTADLGNGAVTNKKIANDAVTGAKINETTLGIVPNADKLDGIDSTDFVAGRGRVVTGYTQFGRGDYVNVFMGHIGNEVGFNVAYRCPGGPLSVTGKVGFTNTSAIHWDVWYQDGGDDPVFAEVAPGDFIEFDANEPSHLVRIHLARRDFVEQASIDFAVMSTTTLCVIHGTATLAR